MSGFNAVKLSLFVSRLSAVCDEMGAILRRSSFSPNIKDRLDFSCAIFDVEGRLCAQAAHIPVHLGSMAFAMKDLVAGFDWQEEDMMIVNDPYLGGTHLPDITLIKPVFCQGKLKAFVANRAHHANVGSDTPGSMPVSSSLEEEGLVIEPVFLMRNGQLNQELWQQLCLLSGNKDGGDFSAQISANHAGARRLQALLNDEFDQDLEQLYQYGETLARTQIKAIPDGNYYFEDFMDDDGQGNRDIKIALNLSVSNESVYLDFTGTSPQVAGNINCPFSVAAAAVYYVFRCLMPAYTPNCDGIFRPITLKAPPGCLINAQHPHAVAAGNVETSTRIVDVVLGALAQAMPGQIPAASYGSMNNIAMGDSEHGWNYYETIGGGGGAHRLGAGLDAVQCHMTNTLNTPIESLEQHYPLKINRYEVRRHSGGAGVHRGGDGIIREYQLISKATVTVLSERRYHSPWGLNGGSLGEKGINVLNGKCLPAKVSLKLKPGDVLSIETPGGGGWNPPE